MCRTVVLKGVEEESEGRKRGGAGWGAIREGWGSGWERSWNCRVHRWLQYVILSHVLHVCGPVLHIHVYVQYCHKCGIADTWIHGYFCIAHTAVLHILQKISIAKVKNESRVHARLRVCE